VTVQSALGSLCIVKTVEADCALSEIMLVGLAKSLPERLLRVGLVRAHAANRVVTTSSIAGDHAEIVGESGDTSLGILSIGEEEVVAMRQSAGGNDGLELLPRSTSDLRKHAANLGDLLVGAIGVAEVEVGCPVGRLVLDDGARGALAVDKVLVGGLLIEACASQ